MQEAGGNPEHEFLDLARKFDWDRVREQLRANPSLVNVGPPGRWSALHQAARAGNAQAVLDLLGHGADPFAETVEGDTPRALAVDSVVKGLLERAEARRTAGVEEATEVFEMRQM